MVIKVQKLKDSPFCNSDSLPGCVSIGRRRGERRGKLEVPWNETPAAKLSNTEEKRGTLSDPSLNRKRKIGGIATAAARPVGGSWGRAKRYQW